MTVMMTIMLFTLIAALLMLRAPGESTGPHFLHPVLNSRSRRNGASRSAMSATLPVPWGWPGNPPSVHGAMSVRNRIRSDWAYSKDLFLHRGRVYGVVFTSRKGVSYINPSNVLKPWGW